MAKKQTPAKRTPAKRTPKAKIEKIDPRFNIICNLIEEEGFSLRKALKINKMSSQTFFEWVEKDELNAKQYTRACTQRADAIFEEIIDIADDNRGDTKIIFDRNGNPIQTEDKEWTGRAKLKIDARKWTASKLNPKKYGDKIELSGDKESPLTVTILNLGNGTKPSENE